MAKINYIKINDTIRYIENVAYLSELPVANEDSNDFVSVNNVLYVKQVNNGTYSYAQVGGGEGGSGITIIQKDIIVNDDGTYTFAEEPTAEEYEQLCGDNVILAIKMEDMIFYGRKTYAMNIDGVSKASWYSFLVGTQVMVEATFQYALDGSAYHSAITPQASSEIKSVVFSAPSTATQGTITSSDLAKLQENDQNYIIFNDEIFRLNDKQHESGYLVYSHNGHDTTGCFFQKCITITISTLGWVLESQENQPKLTAGSNITIVDNVISASGGGSGASSVEYYNKPILIIEGFEISNDGATMTKTLDSITASSIMNGNDFACDTGKVDENGKPIIFFAKGITATDLNYYYGHIPMFNVGVLATYSLKTSGSVLTISFENTVGNSTTAFLNGYWFSLNGFANEKNNISIWGIYTNKDFYIGNGSTTELLVKLSLVGKVSVNGKIVKYSSIDGKYVLNINDTEVELLVDGVAQ